MRGPSNPRFAAGTPLGKTVVGVVLLILGESEGHAAHTAYRCQSHGQTVLTDQPCPDSKAADPSSIGVPAVHNPSAVGRWQGQMQYAGTEAGEEIQAAHSVVSLDLEFTPDGKVSGGSLENGCRWLGVWSQGGKGIERVITLNLSTSHCQFDGLNRKFTGTFLLGVPDSMGQMQLAAFTIALPGQKGRAYHLDGTLRRH
jgi:hypothetical protein